MRAEYYKDQPAEVSLETQAVCNAACKFCPYPVIERKGEKMPDELIDKVIDQLAAFRKPFSFSPFKLSDPLLDNRMHRIIRRVNEVAPLASIRIFTNGSALTEKKIDELNDVGGLELWVSLNETDPDKYKALMGIPFDRTAKNLDALHEADFRHPVKVSAVGNNPDFVKYVYDRWPKFDAVCIKRDGWLGYVDPENPEIPDAPCSRWWELSIMANGIVSLCCMDAEGEYAIGDINKQSLLDIYNSWDYRFKSTRAGLDPCGRCTY